MTTLEERVAEQWWICTDVLARGGEKLLGPFESQKLALEVRRHVEAGGLLRNKKDGRTFWVDSEVTS